MKEATYDPADDKIRLRSTSRIPADTFAAAKACGFAWAPRQELFVAHWSPAREDFARAFSNACEIEAEGTSIEERAAERAERFEDYAGKRSQDADSAAAAVNAIADRIPMGQPILVGHHSERRARRDQKRMQAASEREQRNRDTARFWERRAADLLRRAERMDSPGVRARRLKTLEADARKQERTISEADALLAVWPKVLEVDEHGNTRATVSPLEFALYLANHEHGGECFTLAQYPETAAELERRAPGRGRYEGAMGLYSALQARIITPEQACELATEKHERNRDHAQRWLDHYNHRLAYERAVLAAQGHSPLSTAAERGEQRAALPPIINPRTPVVLLDRYSLRHKGTHVLPVQDMTAAEYAKIYTDQKACSTTPPDSDGVQFRVRVAVDSHRTATHPYGRGLVQVFLTDKPETPMAVVSEEKE
jgi:hypothetical protein